MVGVVGQQLAEVADARRGQRLDRAGRDGIGADALRPQAEGQIARRRFQAGLGQTHGVVVGHGALGAEIGQRQHRGVIAPQQQRSRRLHQRRVAVRRNVVGDAEGVARQTVEEIALDGFGGRVGDGMHQAIKAFPTLAQFLEQGIDLAVVGDVAREDQLATQFVGELGDALLEAIVLVSECEAGAFAMTSLGDAVGDGTVGQQPGDENALAGEKAHRFSPGV